MRTRLGYGLGIAGAATALILILASRSAAMEPPGGGPQRPAADAARSKSDDKDQDARALEELLSAFGEAIRKANPEKIVASFDAERMVDEVKKLGGFAGLKPGQEKEVAKAFATGLGEGFVRFASLIRWSRHEIKQVKYSDDRREAVLTARHWDDEGDSSKFRWWVQKRDGRWRIYDFEDLNTGIRSSVILGTLSGKGLPGAAISKSFERVIGAAQAMQQLDVDTAGKELRAVARVKFPPPLDALRRMLEGVVAFARDEPEEALKQFDRAESLRADLPILHYLRAVVHNGLGNHEKALAHARKYVELLGDDANAYAEIGDALMELKRPTEAAAAYRKGLDDYPDSVENFEGLRKALPAGKKAELGDHFARMSKPGERFEELVEDALLSDDDETAAALIAAYRKKAPDNPAVDYYAARVRILKNDIPEGIRLFKAALARVKDADKRDEYTEGFLDAMVEAGKPVEAYHAAPDADRAFRSLAGSLAAGKDEKPLRRLIDAHRKQRPNDPWLHFYTGQAELIAEDYARAERAFAAGAVQAKHADDQERFRYWQVHARCKAGKGLSAYGEIGPPKATFDQLAEQFADDEDARQLEALVAAHRKADPNDRDLPFWEAEAKWFGREYEKAVRLLVEHRRTILANKERRGTFEDRLVRSLVRLKRFDEAVKEARAADPDEGGLLLQAVAHAAAGDLVRTAEALDRCVKDGGYPVEAFYDDPDLGQALRGERFRELRKKYPEPKDPEAPLRRPCGEEDEE